MGSGSAGHSCDAAVSQPSALRAVADDAEVVDPITDAGKEAGLRIVLSSKILCVRNQYATYAVVAVRIGSIRVLCGFIAEPDRNTMIERTGPRSGTWALGQSSASVARPRENRSTGKCRDSKMYKGPWSPGPRAPDTRPTIPISPLEFIFPVALLTSYRPPPQIVGNCLLGLSTKLLGVRQNLGIAK